VGFVALLAGAPDPLEDSIVIRAGCLYRMRQRAGQL